MTMSLSRVALVLYLLGSVSAARPIRGDKEEGPRRLKKGEKKYSATLSPTNSPVAAPLDSAHIVQPVSVSQTVFIDVYPPSSATARKKHDSKSMEKLDSSKGKGRGKGKGKGKGGGSSPPNTVCTSAVADAIMLGLDEVLVKNPVRCCGYEGPTVVFVTHAQRDDSTPSGFEQFWDTIYNQITTSSQQADVCFVFTGYDQTMTDVRDLADVLHDANRIIAGIPDVTAMMSTDPTDDVDLVTKIREISKNPVQPSIGVFNSGYNNIVIESIVSGLERLPFVGSVNDADHGSVAASTTMNLLNGMQAIPLCYNARSNLQFIGTRCATYYNEITSTPVEAPTGEECSPETTPESVFAQLITANANAVWSHVDCCTAVTDGAELYRRLGRTIVVGCQDEDTTGGRVNFVTALPTALQAFASSSWVNLPAVQAARGNDGRGEQYFPSLQSLVNTAIYDIVIV